MVTNASVFASGYVLDVTINNNGSSTVNGWIVNLPFDQDPQVEIFFGAEIETEGNTGHRHAGELEPDNTTGSILGVRLHRRSQWELR